MAFVKSIKESEESVTAIMRRYPDQAIPLIKLTEIVLRSGECAFDDRARELIAAFASGSNNCTYCFDTHRATAEAFGVDEDLLASLLSDIDSSPIEENMKPVLRYARKLTETPSHIVQTDVAAILDAGWSENDFHYVVMIVGLFNFYNRLIDGHGVRNTAEFRLNGGIELAHAGYGVVTKGLHDAS